MKSPKLLKRENTAFLIVDIQEKLLNVMHNKDAVINNTIKLINGCKTLNVPIYYTEQYPKGLGPTHNEILNLISDYPCYEKDTFSYASINELIQNLKSNNIHNIILCRIESHVCVLQTAFDFDAIGFHVYVIANAVSSRNQFDYEIALRRLTHSNIQIVTTEMVLFEMTEKSGTDEFKNISKIVK